MSTTQHAVTPVPSFRNRFFSHPISRMVSGVLATLVPVMLTMMLADIFVPKSLRTGGWPFLLAAAISLLSYRWFVRRTEQRHTLAELALPGAAREAGAGAVLGASLGRWSPACWHWPAHSASPAATTGPSCSRPCPSK
jgi:hypothetical protein